LDGVLGLRDEFQLEIGPLGHRTVTDRHRDHDPAGTGGEREFDVLWSEARPAI
jgi:hypothetical protein